MNVYILEAWDGEEWIHEGAFLTEVAAVHYAEDELQLEADDFCVFETKVHQE